MASPKTAKLTLEITNDDGSKTRVTTADLDASKLPAHGAREGDAERVIIGMVDPYFDEDDFYGRRDRWITNTLRFPERPYETHFNLNLQLPPVKAGAAVYTIQEFEAPSTTVVMTTDGQGSRLIPCNFDEKTAAAKAEAFSTQEHSDQYTPIYFLLDIP